MSVLLSDLRWYGSANMPEADSATVGGAIDFTKRVEFADVPAAGLFDAVSSSASDTLTKIIYTGLDSSGVPQTETLTLTGQTKVAGTKTLERLLSALASGATSAFGLTTPGGTQAVGDIALMAHTLTIAAHTMQAASLVATTSAPAIAKLQVGDGASVSAGMILRTTGGTGPQQIRRILAVNPGGLGADWVAVDRNFGVALDATTTYEIAPGFHFELTGSNAGVAITGTSTQTLAITRMFNTLAAQASGGSTVTAYEKIFLNNNNQATALTSGTVKIASDTPSLPGSAALDLGVPAGLNDTATATNRQTLPASVTFTVQPATVAVPTGTLPASASAGSAAGAAAYWVRATLPAGTAAYKSTNIDLQANGNTT